MNVLVAPDKFKGTLTAAEAAEALRRGVLDVLPRSDVTCIPLADGGEGTLDALVVGGATRGVLAIPATAPSSVPFAMLEDGSICIEVATTSGGHAVRDPLGASSLRTGEALLAAYARRPPRVFVAIGGSSSTDGGAGIARVHGWRFVDASGRDLASGGGALVELDHIDGAAAQPPACPVIGLCDVRNPLLGPAGAAATFAPQKGASPDDVRVLEAGLERLAACIRRTLRLDVASLERGGAGGGIGAGLAAFLGGELRDGFSFIAAALGVERALAAADVVVTGEGRLDAGSMRGKVVGGIARMARSYGKPLFLVCGEIALDERDLSSLGPAGFADALTTSGRDAYNRPADAVRRAAERALRAA